MATGRMTSCCVLIGLLAALGGVSVDAVWNSLVNAVGYDHEAVTKSLNSIHQSVMNNLQPALGSLQQKANQGVQSIKSQAAGIVTAVKPEPNTGGTIAANRLNSKELAVVDDCIINICMFNSPELSAYSLISDLSAHSCVNTCIERSFLMQQLRSELIKKKLQRLRDYMSAHSVMDWMKNLFQNSTSEGKNSIQYFFENY